MLAKPHSRPVRPYLSSGPCAKRPNWTPAALQDALLGRSHRSKPGKAKLAKIIELSREILGMPEDWRLGIVPASDTGAVEMALWSLLGPRPVDVLSFESFSGDWATDVVQQLRLEAHVHKSPYGGLPDLRQVNWSHDVVFAWNGTTSGVRIPDGDWINAEREGLVICDATSAVFAMDLPWDKLDVVTWSWQKVLGGEAGHGMLALSPHAVQRLTSHTPPWPMPKIFRMTKDGKLIDGIFKGETINTPSMLAVEDQLDALRWAKDIGGLKGLLARTNANFGAVADWVERSGWIAFLAARPEIRSTTSVCLKIIDPWVCDQAPDVQAKTASSIAELLEKEGIAYDIANYRDAPAGFRLWCGATVDTSDLAAVLPWLDWAFATIVAQLKTAA